MMICIVFFMSLLFTNFKNKSYIINSKIIQKDNVFEPITSELRIKSMSDHHIFFGVLISPRLFNIIFLTYSTFTTIEILQEWIKFMPRGAPMFFLLFPTFVILYQRYERYSLPLLNCVTLAVTCGTIRVEQDRKR